MSVAEANQQTLAAAMLTRALENVQLPDKRKAGDVWERIYVVTAFYVGLADDLGRQQYKAALAKVCGAALDLTALGDAGKIQTLRQELAKYSPPAIYSGTGKQSAGPAGVANADDLVKALDKSTGFRLMGQRFIPDSYMMGKLVYPTVGPATRDGIFTRVDTPGGPIRGFPRGLDVMAILGSKRARDVIKEVGDDAYIAGKALDYDGAMKRLTDEYCKLSDLDWNRNMYWSWLHALKPLLAECGAGYQAFMQTKAYRTKSLNTALASWCSSATIPSCTPSRAIP